MKIKVVSLLYFIFSLCINHSKAQIVPGAEQMPKYELYIKGKRLALVVNQTSTVNGIHLADTLLAEKFDVKKIFVPEHGFRGTADAGASVKNGRDVKTGLPLLSLYGKQKKPDSTQLADVDVVIFDIQDVGARFYTYISTLHYIMEACAETGKQLLVLDRPNPNGDYVDGPVLDTAFRSFVGMHPIPIVHGLTVGELARMINGERWLKDGIMCDLKVIQIENYTHADRYVLPAAPSPNLSSYMAIRLYPSLCLFEGTEISVGRGTSFPFRMIGAPNHRYGSFKFKPQARIGASEPLYKDKICYGKDLRAVKTDPGFTLQYLLEFYRKSPDKRKFFNNFFDKLAGTDTLRKQIEAGKSEKEIRASWRDDLERYRVLREKYLLYSN